MIVETDCFGVEPGNFLRKCKINVIYLHTKEKRKAVEYKYKNLKAKGVERDFCM